MITRHRYKPDYRERKCEGLAVSFNFFNATATSKVQIFIIIRQAELAQKKYTAQ